MLRSVVQWVEFFSAFTPGEVPSPISAPEVHAAEEDAHNGQDGSMLPTPCALSVELIWAKDRVVMSPNFAEIERQVRISLWVAHCLRSHTNRSTR